jgi:hypothetical protein
MHLNGIEINQKVSIKNNLLVIWRCQASYIEGGVVFGRSYVRYTAEGYEGGHISFVKDDLVNTNWAQICYNNGACNKNRKFLKYKFNNKNI